MVAIKRMIKLFHATNAAREVALLLKSDGNKHVVRYYAMEETKEFIYLSIELCSYTLAKAVESMRAHFDNKQKSIQLHSKGTRGTTVLALASKTRASYELSMEDILCLCQALLQLVKGVAHLHSLRIVHRDLKPQNVLILNDESSSTKRGCEGGFTCDFSYLLSGELKISDMGLSKMLPADHSSFRNFSQHQLHAEEGRSNSNNSSNASSVSSSSSMAKGHLSGTMGWRPPEVLACFDSDSGNGTSSFADAETSLTASLDIFPLGCIFYHVLSVGSHPFGVSTMRDVNIVQHKIDLTSVKKVPEVLDALQAMTDPNPKNRPTAKLLLSHPMFWPADQKLNFLLDLSDRLEREDNKAVPHGISTLLAAIEVDSWNVVGYSWEKKLDNDLLGDLVKYRKYNTNSVRDLLRVIRNKRHHYHDLDNRVKKRIGSIPSGFYLYFAERFPRLLLHCYNVVVEWLSLEKQFAGYLQTSLSYFQARFKAKLGQVKEASKSNVLQLTLKDAQLTSQTISDDSKGCSHPGSSSSDSHTSQMSPTYERNIGQWYPPAHDWVALKSNVSNEIQRPQQLANCGGSSVHPREDRWRTKLCSHWVSTSQNKCSPDLSLSSPKNAAPYCPYRATGKCAFAHGPWELRPLEHQRRPENLVDLESGDIVKVYETAKKAAELSVKKVHKRPERERACPSQEKGSSPAPEPGTSRKNAGSRNNVTIDL
jgi:serine/threonine protein kinase